MRRVLKYSFPFIIVSILLTGNGCKKETTCNSIPNIGVNFQINLTIGYPQLIPINGTAVYTGGYANNGVLVYHYTQAQFLAYDCTCPYDGTSNAKAIVAVQSNGIYAVCPVCGSSFLLSTGAPNKGPSACPLKAYTATYDQTNNIVTVTN